MSLEETFSNLAAFLNSLDTEAEQKFELAHSLVIICPDDGKNIAFRGRCPKCGGNSWIPAGHSAVIPRRKDFAESPVTTNEPRACDAMGIPRLATLARDDTQLSF